MFKHSYKVSGFEVILTADIGGSHMTTGMVNISSMEIINESIHRTPVRANDSKGNVVIDDLLNAFKLSLSQIDKNNLRGIAIAMPGPFLYEAGVFKIRTLHKYGALFGLDLKRLLYDHLDIPGEIPIYFKNDADCFGLGAFREFADQKSDRLISVTLGTGFGSAFIEAGKVPDNHEIIPKDGNLYDLPLQFKQLGSLKTHPTNGPVLDQIEKVAFKYKKAEDLISSRGLLQYVNDCLNAANEDLIIDIQDLACKARIEGDHDFLTSICREAFSILGLGLATSLKPWINEFDPHVIVIGGGIANASDLFLPSFYAGLGDAPGLKVELVHGKKMDCIPLTGAATGLMEGLAKNNTPHLGASVNAWRKTHQPILPQRVEDVIAEASKGPLNAPDQSYRIYPWSSIGSQKINAGFDSFAGLLQKIALKGDKSIVALDGFAAVDWDFLCTSISQALSKLGVRAAWISMEAFLKPDNEIEALVNPYLGEPCSVWGTKAQLRLADFFDQDLINEQLTEGKLNAVGTQLVIIYGTGAGLIPVDKTLAFVELPKNEIQYRMQAGKASNLFATQRVGYASMYKRAYFVDWPILSQYRSELSEKLQLVIDAQWSDTIHWMFYDDLKSSFKQLSTLPIRVRPWFAPGAWGGDWMKKHIPQLNKEEVNYAWSFELIAPENGMILESDGHLMEVPFDWLMEENNSDILGRDAPKFGNYFPIRFDFLDTFNGGNLSIQCHPSNAYIKKNFGEKVTQDETYYILDCNQGAGVYLGFQQDIDSASFKRALVESQAENKKIDIEKYVQKFTAKKHDLFLIPNQTIHSSGKDNLVLEISATPYIFTFKMYDWVRPDLNGKPRPINIEHAFKNLDFTRKGKQVERELISKPVLLESNNHFQKWDLPTHREHYYAIHRLDLITFSLESTDNKCHMLMLVEGDTLDVQLVDGPTYRYHYAETILIPAAVGRYKLNNPTGKPLKVIKAFLK